MVVYYSLEQHTFETVIAAPSCEPCATGSEAVVCHCLQVTETTVVRAVRDQGARSLCELACLTGAGGGCTSCHRRLRHYLAEGRDSRATEAKDVLSTQY